MRILLILLIFVFFGLTGVGIASNPPSPGQTIIQSNTAATEQHVSQDKSAKRPPLVATPQKSSQHIQWNNGQSTNQPALETQPDPVRLTDIVQAASAALSVLATIVLVAFAGCQIFIYRRQTKVMTMTLKATARSVRASQRSAKAAEDAVTKSGDILAHAEDTAERQLRAYMRVELLRETSISIKPTPGAGINDPLPVRTTIGIANSGQTPANKVTVHSNIIVAPFPLDRPFPEIEIEKGGSKANIHPSQPVIGVEVFSSGRITKSEFAKLAAPNPGEASATRFYMHGKITYRDVFDKPRETNFRCVSDGNNVIGARFTWCSEGNEAT